VGPSLRPKWMRRLTGTVFKKEWGSQCLNIIACCFFGVCALHLKKILFGTVCFRVFLMFSSIEHFFLCVCVLAGKARRKALTYD
jgi:hypothetical protein